MNKTRIISIANHKGGVGKTTTTAGVASILAIQGYHVLAIDIDPQANLTSSLLKGETERTIYLALVGKEEELPIVNISENLDLVPSSLTLAMAELEMVSAMSREKVLSELIEPLKARYDFILIDCPPSLGLLTLNAITASNEVIIPLIAEALPVKGLKMMKDFIKTVNSKLNPDAHISGILFTRWETTKLGQDIEERLRSSLGTLIFKSKIRKNIRVGEAPLKHQNIVEYAPNSNGAKDYLTFTEELLEKFGYKE